MDRGLCGKSSTAEVIARHLQRVLAIYGIPKIVVTDNGPCFVSEIFEDFCHRNGVRHAKVAPYHPSSNGLAERAVQTIKQALSHKPKGMLTADHLARFLLTYRITPHPTTGQAPSQLLMGRQLTSKFDLLYPCAEWQVDAAQERQARAHNQRAKERQGFEPGNTVYIRAYNNRLSKWVKGEIVAKTGPLSYTVQSDELGGERHCHMDQLRTRLDFTDAAEIGETPDEILQDRVNGENEQEPTAEDTETNTDSGIAKRVVSDYTSQRVFPCQDESHSFTEPKTLTTD